MAKTIWLHGIKYGGVFLKEVHVKDETPARYIVAQCSESGYRTHLSKDDKTVSETREDAIARLRLLARAIIETAEHDLACAKDCATIVERFAGEVSP